MKNKHVLMILALMFLTLFCVVYNTPNVADDFDFMRSFYRGETALGTGEFPTYRSFLQNPSPISHAINIMVHHYQNAHGRFLSGYLMPLACGMPHSLYAFITSLLWVCLLWLVGRFSRLSVRLWPLVFCLSCAILLNAEAVVWKTGAADYLWPMTLTMMAVPLFCWTRCSESVFLLRNSWQWAMIPLGMLLAGGHELISIPVCMTMATYWVICLFRKEFSVNGRLLLTFGYGIGSLMLVFAPSTMARAGGVSYFIPDAQILYSVARKFMAVMRVCTANPFGGFIMAASVIAVVKKSWRHKIDQGTWHTMLLAVMMLVVVCGLGDGVGRNGWPASCVILILGFRLFSCLISNECLQRIVRIAYPMCVLLVLLVSGVTAASSIERKLLYDSAVREMRSSKDQLIVLPSDRQMIGDSWCNRSVSLCWAFNLGLGAAWNNAETAQFYGLPPVISLHNEQIALLRALKADCSGLIPLPNVPNWFATNNEINFLIMPLAQDASSCGNAVHFQPRYKQTFPELDVISRLKKRLTREGYAEFSYLSPELEQRNAPILSGFVYQNDIGKWAVVFFNHNIPIDSVADMARVN